MHCAPQIQPHPSIEGQGFNRCQLLSLVHVEVDLCLETNECPRSFWHTRRLPRLRNISVANDLRSV